MSKNILQVKKGRRCTVDRRMEFKNFPIYDRWDGQVRVVRPTSIYRRKNDKWSRFDLKRAWGDPPENKPGFLALDWICQIYEQSEKVEGDQRKIRWKHLCQDVSCDAWYQLIDTLWLCVVV